MAFRIDSRSCDAGNNLGPTTAACNDWHHEPADFHLGTGHQAPTSDAGYTTASEFRISQNYRSLSTCGWSPYTDCWATGTTFGRHLLNASRIAAPIASGLESSEMVDSNSGPRPSHAAPLRFTVGENFTMPSRATTPHEAIRWNSRCLFLVPVSVSTVDTEVASQI